MKKLMAGLLCAAFVFGFALASETETKIVFNAGEITVDGNPISDEADLPVYQEVRTETHDDVPESLKDIENRIVTIAEGGVYRISGSAQDVQIAVRASDDDHVRIILDNLDITCRTAPAIAVYTAAEPGTPAEYAVTLELAEGSENRVNGSHTEETKEDDIKLSGAISSLVSVGFEGNGSLDVEADNEGIEVKFGHMTFNGGEYHIQAGDDPINVSEDGAGVLTVNDGYLYSSVNPQAGGEGDGIDSNGYIVFNGGTIINLAHPDSGDSGIDSDMGSSINGGVVIGAGNMYDPIDPSSEQLFMMLEFAEETDDLLVVTNSDDEPVFAYDFPHSYTYIAFSTPELIEGSYHVYLGGEIEGEQKDGLYTDISSYTPGKQMQHGGSGVSSKTGAAGMKEDMPGIRSGDGFSVDPSDAPRRRTNEMSPEYSDEEQAPPALPEHRGMMDMQPPEDGKFPNGRMRGFGGPRGMESSSEAATVDFVLDRTATGFTGITEK